MNNHFFDAISIEVLFLLTVAFMLLMLEAGYRFGFRAQTGSAKAQTAQVRALMGATLGLLAFMLAFTFSNAQTHSEDRMRHQIDEAVVAKNAFMRAGLAEEPLRTRARELLLDFVNVRLEMTNAIREASTNDIFQLLQRSEEIQLELWSLGVNDEFMVSVLSLMDLHTYRVQAALVNRLPVIIWMTLYFTAVMSMIVVGYQAGLSLKRSPVATYSLALAFAAVMMLIMDLDRPLQSLFELDGDVMQQLAAFMRKEL
jgi:hypothetical protein